MGDGGGEGQQGPGEGLDEVPLLVDPRTGEPISRREVEERHEKQQRAERRRRRRECERPECRAERAHRLPNGLRVCEGCYEETFTDGPA